MRVLVECEESQAGEKICLMCKKLFTDYSKNVNCCSPACKIDRHRQLRREYYHDKKDPKLVAEKAAKKRNKQRESINADILRDAYLQIKGASRKQLEDTIQDACYIISGDIKSYKQFFKNYSMNKMARNEVIKMLLRWYFKMKKQFTYMPTWDNGNEVEHGTIAPTKTELLPDQQGETTKENIEIPSDETEN